MERRLPALHLLIVQNRGFYSAKRLAQALYGFARGKNIQNNAVFADHNESSPFPTALLARFAFFPYLTFLL